MKITVFHDPVELDTIPYPIKLAGESTAVIEDATVSFTYSNKLTKIEGSIWKLIKIDQQTGTLQFELVPQK